MGAPFGWIAVVLLPQSLLGILLPPKYNPPSALLSPVALGPSPVTQRAITDPAVALAVTYE